MRRPEALSAGGAIAGVLEDARDRIAVLQVNGGGLRARRVAATRATTASSNLASVREVGISTAPDGGQGPTQLCQLIHPVGAGIQTTLRVLLSGRRPTVQAEAVVPRAKCLEGEDPTRRVGVFLDDDRAA